MVRGLRRSMSTIPACRKALSVSERRGSPIALTDQEAARSFQAMRHFNPTSDITFCPSPPPSIDRRGFLAGTAALAITPAMAAVEIPIIDCHIHLFDATRPQGAPYK